MKLAKLSLAAVTALTLGTSVYADTVADAFKNGKVSGEIRAMYITTDNDTAGSDADGSAIGGNLGFTTAPINGFTAGAVLYTTNKLTGEDDATSTNTKEMTNTFLVNGEDSYSILGQAYLQYNIDNTMIKIGRQQLDTPLAGSDDIRIIPNLFEAYLLTNTDLPDTTLVAAHVTKTTGWDTTGNNITDFESMSYAAANLLGVGAQINYNKGVTVLAAINSSLPDTTLQAWYYKAHDLLDAIYVDGAYSSKIGDVDFTLGAQYWTMESDSTADSALSAANSIIDFDVFGLMAEASFAGFTALVAYDDMELDANSVTAVHGAWGGYPEYTFAEEFWFNSAYTGNGVDATKVALSYDAGFANFGVAYVMFNGHADRTANAGVEAADTDVLDLTASWNCQFVEDLALGIVYEDRDVDAANSDSDLIKITANYAF